MTKEERELLLAVANAVKLGNPAVKAAIEKLEAKPAPQAETKQSSFNRR